MSFYKNSITKSQAGRQPKNRLCGVVQVWVFSLLMLAAVGVVANPSGGGLNPHDTTKANPPQIGSFHGHPAASGQKLNYDSLFRIAHSFAMAPKAQVLIDNVMRRYGGRSELEKLTTFKLGYAPEGSEDTSVTTTKVWSTDRSLKYSKIAKQPISRLLNGQECWVINEGEIKPASTQRYIAELYSWLVLALPLAIEKESFNGTRYGRGENESLEYLYLLKTDSLMIVVGIDSEDHLIKSCEGIVYGKESRTIFKNLFSDFREVQGYVFPHRIQNFSMGLDMGALILKNVEINPTLLENLFQPKQPIEAAPSH